MRALPAALLALLAAGCSTLDLELGAPIDEARCSAFELGRTRRAEVLAALGPPTSLAAHGGGVAMLWEHVVLDERQLGISLEQLGALLGVKALGLIKFSFGSSGSQRTAALMLFDARGILVGARIGDWEEVFGEGSGMQLFVTVEQVVDTGNLRGLPRGLTWGSELLDPLRIALNQQHRADVALRGTPGHAGQRTLEQQPVDPTKR